MIKSYHKMFGHAATTADKHVLDNEEAVDVG